MPCSGVDGLLHTFATTSALVLVVIPRLEDDEILPIDDIHQAMLIIDASRPASLKDVAKLLWLADPGERIPQRGLEQPVESLHRRAVGGLPVKVVGPTMRGEDEAHYVRSWASRSPERACARLSSSRRALAGARSR